MSCSFLVRKLGSVLPRSCLRTLYFAYFNSHLSYCMHIWFPLLRKVEQNSLFVMQKCLVRLICGVPRTQHCMPLFKKEMIITLWDLIILENCKLMHRLCYNLCPRAIEKMFDRNKYNTRSGAFSVSQHKIKKFNDSFLCKSIQDWAKVPVELRLIEKRNRFVKHFKMKLVAKY